ncbi:MAG: YSC84-related protein [Pseudomonadota bacterium]
MNTSKITRRGVLAGGGAGLMAVAGCASSNSINSAGSVDASVERAVAQMYERLPFTQDIAGRAAGMLVMPGIVKGGFIVGGAYGEGALRLPGDGYSQSAAYYSFGAASVGYQAGLQKTAHALFFMTPAALSKFQTSQNWEVGADAEVTVIDTGVKADLNTTVAQQPVLAVIFSQQGLLAGASLEGAKYSRILT